MPTFLLTASLDVPADLVPTGYLTVGNIRVPASFVKRSRVHREHTVKLGEAVVTLTPEPGITVDGLKNRASLRLRSEHPDCESALDHLLPVLEDVIDSLALQTNEGVRTRRVCLLELPDDAQAGDLVDGLQYDEPLQFMAKYTRLDGGVIATRAKPGDIDLADARLSSSGRLQRARWWYVKGLDTEYLLDKLIAFWIALETLSAGSRDTKRSSVYVAPCSHEIPDCPQCGKPTKKEVQGGSHQAYLRSLGVSAETAAELWKLRQLVHGQDRFKKNDLVQMARLTPLLQSAVLQALRTGFQISLDAALPQVEPMPQDLRARIRQALTDEDARVAQLNP